MPHCRALARLNSGIGIPRAHHTHANSGYYGMDRPVTYMRVLQPRVMLQKGALMSIRTMQENFRLNNFWSKGGSKLSRLTKISPYLRTLCTNIYLIRRYVYTGRGKMCNFHCSIRKATLNRTAKQQDKRNCEIPQQSLKNLKKKGTVHFVITLYTTRHFHRNLPLPTHSCHSTKHYPREEEIISGVLE